jgi:hypothetical protein
MAIPQSKSPAVFSVPNKFPDLPTLPSLKSQDMQLLVAWWNEVQKVLNRQFTQLTTVIDTKQNKP